MSRIAPIREDQKLSAKAARILQIAEEYGAPDPRMARVMVRSDVGVAMLEMWHYVMYNGLLPHRLKEIVRIYLSVAEGCAYCSSIRSTQGKAEGVTDELLMGLADIEANPHLSTQEKAALRFARSLKRGEADDDAVFADLRTSLTDEQILELGFFCGSVLGGGMFAKLLHVVDGDVCSLGQPAQIKDTSTV